MKKGFALIYVLMLMTIIMVSMTSVISSGASDSRQKNKVLFTAGAFQMAQSGLEDGIANYRKDPAACIGPKYFNVFKNNYTATKEITALSSDQGNYEFTTTCTGSNKSVTAAGYFKGSKVRMRADLIASPYNDKWDIYQVGF